MAVESLAPELVGSLGAAAREVLETMASTTPSAIDEVPETADHLQDEVIGLLGFTGTRSGTFAVRTTELVARSIAAKMLMMTPEELGDFGEAADGFGELVNMISGNFKNAWVATGNQMDLSVPHVIHLGRVSISHPHEGTVRSCVRVTVPEGQLMVGVHFEAQ
ncbi:MAG: chemotaxis protein CheX [Planctomycetota bacterium]